MKRYPHHYQRNSKPPHTFVLYLERILFFLFVFFLPTQFGKHFFFSFSYLFGVRVDYLAPTIYLTDILALLIILTHLSDLSRLLKPWRVQFAIFALSITVWSAQNQLLALYGFVKCVELLGVGAVFYSRASRNAQTIFFAFLTSALMQGLIVLSQFILNHSVGGVFYYLGERPINLTLAGIAKIAFDGRQYVRPYGTFSHPNSMAGFYLLLFAYYFQLPYITRNRVFHSLFLLLCSILILISFSKTAIIGFTIIHFIQLFHRWDYYRDCVVCFISRILVVVIPSLIFIQGQGDPLSVSGRLGLLNNAFRIIKEFPLLGVGLRNYSLYQHTFFNDYQFFFAQPVHNIFLLLACEIGIPLTFYFGYLFLLLLKNKKVNFVLVAFLITGMVDHYWFTLQQNWLLLPLIFAMI